ncbi:MAG: UbiA-like polyprenyltransferase [Bacteroidia bacterium]
MKNYLSLIKFSHTIFALPFALVGAFWGFQVKALTWENWDLLVKVVLCMVFARSAAMAFNRYIDREIDAKNVRTQIREIPAGIISPQNALFFIIFNCAAFVLTTYFINNLCFALSPVALLVILGYSYTKRFTALCHLVLGLGLALAPVGAFMAVTNTITAAPIVLGFAVLCWVSGFDIIYALQDESFDKENKLNSIPVMLGTKNALNVSNLLHFIAALLILTFGYLVEGGILYWVGATCFIALLIYQHLLVKPNDLSKVNLAFFTTNGIAAVVFAVCVLLGWWL